MKDTIHLLVSFDENYIPPFKTMLYSIVRNHPGERFHVWLLHGGMPEAALEVVSAFCRAQGAAFDAAAVDRAWFEHAPVSKQYPQEMYYRLLAAHILPPSLSRVLYLDPDILVINSLRPLWEMDLKDCVFAAASHSCMPEVMNGVNRYRLDTDHDYYNTGVLLMDLDKARRQVVPQEIFDCVRERALQLVLPDQDVFNALYGRCTAPLDDRVFNYDARRYRTYQLKNGGACTIDWIMRSTAILHFCGKEKPWKKGRSTMLGTLYKHYMVQAQKCSQGDIAPPSSSP